MSKADKKVNCKSCGAEISAAAAVCPACGVKVKKPIYKKWWFWVIIAIIIIASVSSGGNDADIPSQEKSPTSSGETAKETDAPEIEYIVCDVTDLFKALDENALKAEKTYNGQYVEVSGYLGTIDSSGDYIGLRADENNYDYLFQEITCNIKSDEQLDKVMELSSNDAITVKGKIVDVGEILGYTLSIDSIS